ncbi:MAG: ribosome maturation factor RimM [Clostridium sp.]|nr:ribosome maturation factor RimM [Clostridium sp.]MCM1548150.1 ribosome maturation factor RimM [Ruminococcus sp.]
MKNMLESGKIVNTHGIKGEIKVVPWCDYPEFLCEFDTIYIGKEKTPYTVDSARVHKNTVLIRLSGINTPEAANALRNKIVYIDRNEIELEEGAYFIQDIIGLTVKNADTGRIYGEIKDVLQTGANDVYEIKNGDKTYLVPAIEDVVIETDIDNSIMLIRPLEGLFDED